MPYQRPPALPVTSVVHTVGRQGDANAVSGQYQHRRLLADVELIVPVEPCHGRKYRVADDTGENWKVNAAPLLAGSLSNVVRLQIGNAARASGEPLYLLFVTAAIRLFSCRNSCSSSWSLSRPANSERTPVRELTLFQDAIGSWLQTGTSRLFRPVGTASVCAEK